MPCPRCGDEPPLGARFCPACGASLAEAATQGCFSCGAPVLGGAQYCWACGSVITEGDATPSLFSPLDTPAAPHDLDGSLRRFLPAQYLERLRSARGALTGERRVVTILFADVKGSTAMADRLDPEEVLEIMNGAFRVLIEPITGQGGTIARLMGDAVLAFFGAPIAHEDDPRRAARAALEILQGARSYAEQLAGQRGITGFGVRVGMNTGLVVLAEVGDGDRVEYTAMGDAVNLASRMESTAEPGTILMTEATRKLLGPRFVTASIGALPVRGKAEPVLVHRLLAENDASLQLSRTHRTPVFGRSAELARIRQVFDQARRGRGAMLVLTGEAGVGKSRLAEEARRASGRGWQWVEVDHRSAREVAGYGAARSLLVGLSGCEDEARAHSVLREQIERLDADSVPRLLPYLSLVLGSADQESADQLDHLDPVILRARIAQALQQYISLLAATRPVAVLWDDFHAIDQPSVTLLESLVVLVREAPVVIVAVRREQEGLAETFLQRIKQEMKSRVRFLRIGSLSRQASWQMLSALLGRRRIPQTVRQEILAKTQGNALFLQEVVRQVLEDLPRGGSGAGRTLTERGEIAIPETLRGIVMARFDALAAPERAVLQAASILEGGFAASLLARILGGQRTPAAVEASLEELRRRGFLVSTTRPGRPAVYEFSHHLTRQLVVENMLHAQQKQLHRMAAEAIEEQFSDRLDEQAPKLAVHYELAGNPARACDYLLRAVRRAGAGAAAQMVVDLCHRGLALAGQVELTAEVVGEFHERLADALTMLARYDEAIEHYDLARSADFPALSQAVLGRKRATLLEKIGRYDEAVAGFELALDHLKSAMDLPEAARIFLGLGRVYCRRGECTTATDMSLMALEMVEQEGDDWGIALASNTLGVIHTMAGDLPAALEALRRAEIILRAKNEQYDLSATLMNLGWAHHKLGQSKEAADYLLGSIQLCEATGNRHGLATASDLLSQVLVARGERRQADRHLRRAVKIFSGSGGHALVPELWGQMGAW